MGPDIANFLKIHHLDGGVVAGICGGTLALARANLLDQTTLLVADLAAFRPN
jgi:putative intracellular protease/amidase